METLIYAKPITVFPRDYNFPLILKSYVQIQYLKVASAIFYQIFISYEMKALQNL